MIKTILKDPLQVPIGPITRSREKKLTDAFNRLIHNIWDNVDFIEATSTNKN